MLFEKIDEFFKSTLSGKGRQFYLNPISENPTGTGCIPCAAMHHFCQCDECQRFVTESFLGILNDSGVTLEQFSEAFEEVREGSRNHFRSIRKAILKGRFNYNNCGCFTQKDLQAAALLLEGVSGKAS